MRRYINFYASFLLLLLAVTSCNKDEQRVIFEGGTAPVLKASSTNSLTLRQDNKDKPALTLSWTNPDYRFNTGVSSQDVNYVLQIDTAGVNFASSNVQEMSISKELGVTLTVKQVNDFLTKMELKAGRPYNMEMRIKSTLGNGSVPLFSNVLKITMTPYLDFVVEPPGTAAANYNDGNLWIVGDAVASGWKNPLPAPFDTSQKFTRIDVLHYVATLNFNASGGYKLIQRQGDWSSQYHALDGSAKLEGSFEKKDSDPTFPSPGAGRYRVEINFQTGKYKLTKL